MDTKSKSKTQPPAGVDKEHLYYQALHMAFDEFIKEERSKCVATELRLMAKIEAARELYKRY